MQTYKLKQNIINIDIKKLYIKYIESTKQLIDAAYRQIISIPEYSKIVLKNKLDINNNNFYETISKKLNIDTNNFLILLEFENINKNKVNINNIKQNIYNLLNRETLRQLFVQINTFFFINIQSEINTIIDEVKDKLIKKYNKRNIIINNICDKIKFIYNKKYNSQQNINSINKIKQYFINFNKEFYNETIITKFKEINKYIYEIYTILTKTNRYDLKIFYENIMKIFYISTSIKFIYTDTININMNFYTYKTKTKDEFDTIITSIISEIQPIINKYNNEDTIYNEILFILNNEKQIDKECENNLKEIDKVFNICEPNTIDINFNCECIKTKYNIEFDTLVLDCEGAFYYILMDMPEILDNINLIIMENDYQDYNHKLFIDDVLRTILSEFDCAVISLVLRILIPDSAAAPLEIIPPHS